MHHKKVKIHLMKTNPIGTTQRLNKIIITDCRLVVAASPNNFFPLLECLLRGCCNTNVL